MDNIISSDDEEFFSQFENREIAIYKRYKPAKGRIRWLLLLGIEPLEDDSGNIIYHCINIPDMLL